MEKLINVLESLRNDSEIIAVKYALDDVSYNDNITSYDDFKYKFIECLKDNLDDDEKIEIVNDINSWNDSFYDLQVFENCECIFNEVMSKYTPFEIFEKTFENYDEMDDFFKFDSYNYVISLSIEEVINDIDEQFENIIFECIENSSYLYNGIIDNIVDVLNCVKDYFENLESE